MADRPVNNPQARARAKALGRHLRGLRESRGWTRDRLAREAGIPTRTLVRLESEAVVEPRFFTIGALATALHVSLDELFTPPRLKPGLWSAGYEGRDIDSFVAALLSAQIDTVADVRLTPVSRKPGFSKKRLGEALGRAGVEYLHLRGLGNPRENRAPFREGRVAEGQARFRALLHTEAAQGDLTVLAERGSTSRVVVLCFERDEEHCHRKVVLDVVRERTHVPVTPLD
jgi:transcriptional regulator with XRE-family HTH domain